MATTAITPATVAPATAKEPATFADYLAAGYAHYDALADAGRIRFSATMSRDRLARAYAEVAAPADVIEAHKLAQRQLLNARYSGGVR